MMENENKFALDDDSSAHNMTLKLLDPLISVFKNH